MYRIYVIGPRVIKSRDIEFVGYVTRLRVDFDVDLILYKAVTYIHVVRVVESGFVVIEVNHGIASEAPMAPGQFRVRQDAGVTDSEGNTPHDIVRIIESQSQFRFKTLPTPLIITARKFIINEVGLTAGTIHLYMSEVAFSGGEMECALCKRNI